MPAAPAVRARRTGRRARSPPSATGSTDGEPDDPAAGLGHPDPAVGDGAGRQRDHLGVGQHRGRGRCRRRSTPEAAGPRARPPRPAPASRMTSAAGHAARYPRRPRSAARFRSGARAAVDDPPMSGGRAAPRGGPRRWGLAAAAGVALAAGTPARPRRRAGTPVPGAGGCPMFPADNVWNTDISALPVRSPQRGLDGRRWRRPPPTSTPTSARRVIRPTPTACPSRSCAAGHPFVEHHLRLRGRERPRSLSRSAPTRPSRAAPAPTGDRHAIMVDPTTCTLYELYDATYSAGGSTAGSGAIWNLRSNALRPATWTSADAAGLPILPGLLRYDEVLSGSVTHAIRMTAITTDTSFVWPARHQAGRAIRPLPPADGGAASGSAPTSTCRATRRRRRWCCAPCSTTG